MAFVSSVYPLFCISVSFCYNKSLVSRNPGLKNCSKVAQGSLNSLSPIDIQVAFNYYSPLWEPRDLRGREGLLLTTARAQSHSHLQVLASILRDVGGACHPSCQISYLHISLYCPSTIGFYPDCGFIRAVPPLTVSLQHYWRLVGDLNSSTTCLHTILSRFNIRKYQDLFDNLACFPAEGTKVLTTTLRFPFSLVNRNLQNGSSKLRDTWSGVKIWLFLAALGSNCLKVYVLRGTLVYWTRNKVLKLSDHLAWLVEFSQT